MRPLLRLLWRLLKPALVQYLAERALRLPTSARNDLATKLNIDPSCIDAINDAIADYAIQAIQHWNP